MNRRRPEFLWWILAVCLMGTSVAQEPTETSSPTAPPAPLKSGLTESAKARLAQLDITVHGDPARASRLRAEQFRIQINRTVLTAFTLDRHCPTAPAIETLPSTELTPSRAQPGSESKSKAVAELRPSYLFYFDQPHLTLPGRIAAIRAAEQLIDSLVVEGSRAMLVSNAAELTRFQSFTEDPLALRAALKLMENDRQHLDLFAEQEPDRVGQVVESLNAGRGGGVHQAVGFARMYQRLEARRAERSLHRLSMTLASLSEIEPPKAVIFFADTLRSNAGDHYMNYFGRTFLEQEKWMSSVENVVAEISFDRLVNEAAGQGIRFYTIKADGLAQTIDPLASAASMSLTQNNFASNRGRQQHTQDTLANLARESGGDSFIFGVRPKRIAETIRQDLSCVYIASFDPSAFDEDQALRVKVTLSDTDLEVDVRGRLVVPSERARTTAKLLAAFTGTDEDSVSFGVRAQIIPTGRRGDRYSALLQIRIPPNSLTSATWDLGASAVEREQVRHELSGSMSIDRSGTTLIFERELELKFGDYDVTYVAHERGSGLVESDRLRLLLPKLGRNSIEMLGITVFQPEAALFLRDEQRRSFGPVSQAATSVLDSTKPTALVSVVCGGSRSTNSLTVHRSLAAADTVDFLPLEIVLEPDSCTQIRDYLPAGKLTAGANYDYQIRLTQGDKELGAENRLLRFDSAR